MAKETEAYVQEMAEPSHCKHADMRKAHRAYVKVIGLFGVQVLTWLRLLDEASLTETDPELKSRAFELRQKITAADRQLRDMQTSGSKLFLNLERIEQVHADFCEKKDGPTEESPDA